MPAMNIAACARETAIYLLHIAAEIEHALMDQYLYAAYSLGGAHLTPAQQKIAHGWRQTIAEIAREEMAHLATVENLLTLIGGPIYFDREDYPVPTELYPFPLELEPLSKRSLGKYVLAESPSWDVVEQLKLTREVEAIQKFVGVDQKDKKIHRVGVVYDWLIELFTMPPQPEDPEAALPPFIASCDISAASIKRQARRGEWGLGYTELLIETAKTREGAVSALNAIAKEGEGFDISELHKSHFGKFLEIYRKYPDGEWSPSRNLAHNPSTVEGRGSYIENATARTWAKLFNLRYRMLLMYLAHSFDIEAPEESTAHSPRGLLISWAFGEMYNLRSIAEIVMTLPLDNGKSGTFAGPPFEMPYSLALPSHKADRWRGHRDLIEGSMVYVNELLKHKRPEWEKYLVGLQTANQRAVSQMLAMIGD